MTLAMDKAEIALEQDVNIQAQLMNMDTVIVAFLQCSAVITLCECVRPLRCWSH